MDRSVHEKSTTRLASGKVTSTAMNKTVTVLVERRVKHPKYGKVITRSKRYHVHCEAEDVVVGDIIEFRSCQKISKSKSWIFDRIVRKTA